jgi:hypothetical protein
MTRLLLLDDAASINELVARELVRHGVCEVTALARVEDLLSDPRPAYEIAVVDLSFPGSHYSGIDALLHLYTNAPDAALVVLTQGDDWVADMLRDAWEAFPLATAISKSAAIATLVSTLEQVITTGSAPVDPVLAPLLPVMRSPWRSLEGYARLIQHAGHAKLWRALIEADADPSYRDLALATGLTVNTVRNYREQLLSELALHGLDNPAMREMQVFARRCRPLLDPYVRARLEPRSIATGA